MSLYPSLEDMTVGQMAKAQAQQQQQRPAIAQGPYAPPPNSTTPGPSAPQLGGGGLYPSLANEYMGLELTKYVPPSAPPQAQQAVVRAPGTAVATPSNTGAVSGLANVGIRRAEIKQGIRQVVICKDAKGKCGVSLFSVNKGVFVCYVAGGSPAALGGLRFGDQILTINGEVMAGLSGDKASKVIKKATTNDITLAVRDRPFERTITLQKDSANRVGFTFNGGLTKNLVRDSSAARNGVLSEHYLCEVNGQNVIGLKDKAIADIFADSPKTVTITIMPQFVYDHMMKNMGSVLKRQMDHSIPDV